MGTGHEYKFTKDSINYVTISIYTHTHTHTHTHTYIIFFDAEYLTQRESPYTC
jgi:hypothetical protein